MLKSSRLKFAVISRRIGSSNGRLVVALAAAAAVLVGVPLGLSPKDGGPASPPQEKLASAPAVSGASRQSAAAEQPVPAKGDAPAKTTMPAAGSQASASFIEKKVVASADAFVMPALAEAKIQHASGAEAVAIQSLPSGVFPRMQVGKGEKLAIQVTIPRAKPGDAVVAQVQDGGNLENGVGARVLKADAGGQVGFTYEVSQAAGIHHVVISHGGQENTLCFWAGEPQEALQN